MTAPLLPPELLERLARLQLGTRRRLGGSFAGDHTSRQRGTSLDFADYREYHPGDDFRRVDYNLLARLDQLVVKLFESDDDLTVRLLIDTSASMALHGKLRCAEQVAGVFGFVSLLRRDVVELWSFPNGQHRRRFRGHGGSGALFEALVSLQPGGLTDVPAAAGALLAGRGVAGCTILVSDLLTPDWEPALRRLPSRGDDLLVVHVVAQPDIEPDLVGDLDLVDVETGARVAVSLSADARRDYRRHAEAWIDRVRAAAMRAGAGYVRVDPKEPVDAALVAAWQRQGALR